MKYLVLSLFLLFASCAKKETQVSDPHPSVAENVSVEVPLVTEVERVKPTKEVTLWGTWYHTPIFKSSLTGVTVRDIKGNSLGVKLSRKEWCSLALEGTGFINGKTYNYAGTSRKYKVKCQHRASGKAKFYVTKHAYGVGNKNNPLVPFYSIACDQSKFKFGLEFYIPDAVGTLLPNGTKHDGYFRCDDVGGLIKENHIDVFIGKATKNPFSFVKSTKSGTFTAYLK